MLHDGRYPTVKLIEEWEIRNGDLAKIANVPQPRVSDYTSGKPVSGMVARRIEDAVRNIVLVLDTFKPIKIALDDPEAFAKAVELAKRTHACESAWESYEAGYRMREEHNTESMSETEGITVGTQ